MPKDETAAVVFRVRPDSPIPIYEQIVAQVTFGSPENPALRSDQPRRNFSRDEALANAPEQGAGHFKVPSVIERE